MSVLKYIYFNVVDKDANTLDRESAIRGRKRSEMLTAIVRIATYDFSNFSIADAKLDSPIPTPRYCQLYVRLSSDDRVSVDAASAERFRKPASLIYTIVRIATKDFTDFSIIDNGSTAKSEEQERKGHE